MSAAAYLSANERLKAALAASEEPKRSTMKPIEDTMVESNLAMSREDESMEGLTLATLCVKLERAEECLEACMEDSRKTAQNETWWRNRLNKIQKMIDKEVATLRGKAARDSDWGQQRLREKTP